MKSVFPINEMEDFPYITISCSNNGSFFILVYI